MADRYLLESGAPDGYLLEDGSGVLSLESTVTVHQGNVSFSGAGTFAAAAAAQLAATWSVTGAATFAAAGARKASGAWSVTGVATFAAAGVRKAAGAMVLQGAASFAADGQVAGAGVVHQGTVAFTGAAVFDLDGTVVTSAPALTGFGGVADPRLAKFLAKKRPARRPRFEEPVPVYALPNAEDEDWEAVLLALLV